MNVKRYIGEDIAECMAQVREELGVDAFILNQRPIRRKGVKGWFQKPLIEVVAAYEPKEEKPPRAASRYVLSDSRPIFPPPEAAPPPPTQPRPAPVTRDAISPQDAHAAAMSVLERIAAKNSPPPRETPPPFASSGDLFAGDASESLPPKPLEAGGIPTAPAAISAYSPHQLRRPVPISNAPARTGNTQTDAGESLVVEAPTLKQTPFTGVPSPALGLAGDDDDGFRPAILPLVREEPEPEREIQDITHLESKLDALSTTLGTLVNKMQISKDPVRGSYPAAVEDLLLSLIENDVHEEFAHKLAREAAEIIHRQNADARDVLEQLIRQTIGEPAPLKLRRFQRTVVMLVGPTGVGKTTTLAKLAAIYQLNHHAKVGVITTDTFRIAAVQQLRTYAEILEVPLSVVYTPADITDALRDHEDKDVVLIDTAGKSPNDTTLEAEITELIKSSDCDEVHLVLSATTGFTGLLNIINTYSFLRDYKVLFTKLDETPSWGMILNTKFLTDKPISYIAAGQTVPDDIEVMTPRKIIDRLLGR